jgi:hypothetical protein
MRGGVPFYDPLPRAIPTGVYMTSVVLKQPGGPTPANDIVELLAEILARNWVRTRSLHTAGRASDSPACLSAILGAVDGQQTCGHSGGVGPMAPEHDPP